MVRYDVLQIHMISSNVYFQVRQNILIIQIVWFCGGFLYMKLHLDRNPANNEVIALLFVPYKAYLHLKRILYRFSMLYMGPRMAH